MSYKRKPRKRYLQVRVPAVSRGGQVVRKAHTKQVPDKGKPGRTPKGKRWFKPAKHRGWRKSQSPEVRRQNLFDSTDRRKTFRNRLLEVARAIQSLANVTTDPETRKKARADAKYFYELAGKRYVGKPSAGAKETKVLDTAREIAWERFQMELDELPHQDLLEVLDEAEAEHR